MTTKDIFDKPLTKGRLCNANNINQYIEFQFNPDAFKDDIGVEWSEIKGAGMSYPIQQYTGGKTRKINFTLFLNDIEKHGVLRKTINFLHSFIPPAKKQGYQFHSPPALVFAFGWFAKLVLLEDMQIDYHYFSPDLQPLMCTINLTFIIVQ